MRLDVRWPHSGRLKKINDRIAPKVLKTPQWHLFGQQFRIEADNRRERGESHSARVVRAATKH
jgi:hypothetical protein